MKNEISSEWARNAGTWKQTLDNILKSYKRFCKNPYISWTVGGAVFKLLRYLQDMRLMIPTNFCADTSNCLRDIKTYTKFHSFNTLSFLFDILPASQSQRSYLLMNDIQYVLSTLLYSILIQYLLMSVLLSLLIAL